MKHELLLSVVIPARQEYKEMQLELFYSGKLVNLHVSRVTTPRHYCNLVSFWIYLNWKRLLPLSLLLARRLSQRTTFKFSSEYRRKKDVPTLK